MILLSFVLFSITSSLQTSSPQRPAPLTTLTPTSGVKLRTEVSKVSLLAVFLRPFSSLALAFSVRPSICLSSLPARPFAAAAAPEPRPSVRPSVRPSPAPLRRTSLRETKAAETFVVAELSLFILCGGGDKGSPVSKRASEGLSAFAVKKKSGKVRPLSVFLPFILGHINQQSRRQFIKVRPPSSLSTFFLREEGLKGMEA